MLPAVAGAGFKRAVLQSFRETMAANMNLTILINLLFAGVIAFGVVYNAARVSLSERSRELASLRVLGFTRAEISLILLGELALLTLAALPVGRLFGYGLSAAIVSTDRERGLSLSAVRLAAGGGVVVPRHHRRGDVSGLLVRRRLDRLDLVAVLKIRRVSRHDADLLKNSRGSGCSASLVVAGHCRRGAVARVRSRSTSPGRTRGPMQVTIDEEGETRVRERFVVSAPVAGRLQRIELEPGDPRGPRQDRRRPPDAGAAAAARSRARAAS